MDSKTVPDAPSNFEPSFQKVIRLEGGFTLHRNKTEHADTYAGIYRAAHPQWEGWAWLDKGQQPPSDQVRQFYKTRYWDVFNGINDAARTILFESAVNIGTTKAVKLAQIVTGALADGVPGPKTQQAINAMEPESFTLKFTLARIKHYNDLAKEDRYRPYLRGWINRALEALV